jgi:hypothetical protein
VLIGCLEALIYCLYVLIRYLEVFNRLFRGVNRLFTCESVGDAVGVGVQFLVCYHSSLPCQLQARVVGEAIRLGIGEGRRGEGRGEE